MSSARMFLSHFIAWALVLIPGTLLDLVTAPLKYWRLVGLHMDQERVNLVRRERIIRDVRSLMIDIESDVAKRRAEKRSEVN